MSIDAYNPSDVSQRKFLASIAQGESGGDYNVGWTGVDLSSAPTGDYGFPQWSGRSGPSGTSHAAGAYQFQPGTWERIASKYNLDWRNPADQDAGAWYLAQEDYEAKAGRDLSDDISAGAWSKIASSLRSTWTSITASSLAAGASAELSPGATGTETPSFLSDPVGAATTYFVRGGMILIGAVILGIALWAILSKADMVPNAVSLGK